MAVTVSGGGFRFGSSSAVARGSGHPPIVPSDGAGVMSGMGSVSG